MMYLIKSMLIVYSSILILKAVVKEDFNYLYDGTLIGLLGFLIRT